MLWLIVSFLSVIFAYFGDYYSTPYITRRGKICFRLLLVLTLSYITGLGGSISSDHNAYIWHFNNYSQNGILSVADSFKHSIFDEREGFEPLFAILNVLVAKLGLSVVGFFLVVAIITNSLFVSVIFKFKLPYLSVILFLVSIDYFQEVNILRQMLAVSICFFSLKYFEEKKLVKFVGLVILSSFIHSSAVVVLLLVLFLPLLNREKRDLLLFVLLTLWLFSIIIAFELLQLDVEFLSVASHYQQLLDEVREGATFDLIFNLFVLSYFFFSFVEGRNNRLTIYAVVFVLGCVFRNFAVQYFWFYRISFYFTFVFCCFVPNYFYNLTIKGQKTSIAPASVILITVYYVLVLFKGYILNDPTSKLGTKMYEITDIIVK